MATDGGRVHGKARAIPLRMHWARDGRGAVRPPTHVCTHLQLGPEVAALLGGLGELGLQLGHHAGGGHVAARHRRGWAVRAMVEHGAGGSQLLRLVGRHHIRLVQRGGEDLHDDVLARGR